mgnify:CR=1 FL=1
MGTRCISCVDCAFTQDHPHACGDKYLPNSCNVSSKGSSPRVWGQVSPSTKNGERIRIIPTRVGTRGNSFRSAVRTEDHPHACGDKLQNIKNRGGRIGSSPRVWGQGKRALKTQARTGIIPTRVGTSNIYDLLNQSI